MDRKRKPRAKRKPNPGSLLAPSSMGGIAAGTGFDFQARYAACQLPVWLLEAGFHQLFHEGSGDIDIRYQEGEKSYRAHLQIKDHEVTVAEFKEVVQYFQTRHASLPNVYRQFTLVCPSLAAKLRPIETGLARFRNARPFYDDEPSALDQTREELDNRLRRLGFDQGRINFLHASVWLEIGHGDLRHEDRAMDLFVARLQKHPEYADKIRAVVQPAFAEVLRAIQGKRGAVLERAEVEQMLRAAVAAVSTTAGVEKSITIWAQNWTRETFDVPADFALDWSEHFERGSRRVPSEELWNTRLIPELKLLKEKIQARQRERVIRLRGKCALSSGIALGASFPTVGGWTFEVPQPPSREAWRSDAESTNPYDLELELVDRDGTDLVLGLNIRGDGREDVRRYIESSGVLPKLFAFIAPPQQQGSQSIRGAADACAFARAVRETMGRLLKQYGISRTRLFFYGPFALAVFLGQQLTSVGEVQLFEYQDPGYVPSCTLRT